jgi:predicted nucleic acid-binding protein
MIAADTSSLIAYFTGDTGPDVEKIVSAMRSGILTLPPAVITELLTDAGASAIERDLRDIALLEVTEGYWLRAGHARRIVMQRGFKAKIGDALIAQSCIDHGVALITRDRDFRHFAKHCGLKLA